LPQTTGHEWARPGIFVFQRTFCIFVASHAAGVGLPSPLPSAPAPRNCGQFCAPAVADKSRHRQRLKLKVRLILFSPDNLIIASTPSGGAPRGPRAARA
jgi:hypothetical protein